MQSLQNMFALQERQSMYFLRLAIYLVVAVGCYAVGKSNKEIEKPIAKQPTKPQDVPEVPSPTGDDLYLDDDFDINDIINASRKD